MHHGRLILLFLLALPASLAADWRVDNESSRLSFISTKAGTVAEVHGFGELAGRLQDDGSFRLQIDLDSVDTGIPIRDERMRELLFETGNHPRAAVSAQLDMATLERLDVGAQTGLDTEAMLELHGSRLTLNVTATVARLDQNTLLVDLAKPLVIDAGEAGLAAGVEKLREVAGLDAISPAVPVTARLTLKRVAPENDAP